MTIVSPPRNPDVICVCSRLCAPVVTLTSCATDLSSTTITVPAFAFVASSVTAAVGTTTAFATPPLLTVTRAALLGRRRPSGFGSVIHNSTARLCGSAALPTRLTVPCSVTPGIESARIVKRLAAFVCFARVVEGALRIADSFDVLRVRQRDRTLTGVLHANLRLAQRRRSLGLLRGQVARLEHGQNLAAMDDAILQQS